MSTRNLHQAFASIARPVIVVGQGTLLYVNPALESIDGRPLQSLLGLPLEKVIQGEPQAGAHVPAEWGRLRGTARPGQWVRLWRSSGPGEGEETIVLEEAGEEVQTRRLADALIRATPVLLASRDEDALFEHAVDVLYEQGFMVTLFTLEGGRARFRSLRNLPSIMAAAAEFHGGPLNEESAPLAAFDFAETMFRERRAIYDSNVWRVGEAVHASPILSVMKASFPIMRALNAPVFVDDRPFGWISVFAEAITPTSASVVEMFARQLGAAIENLHHHRRAKEQLTQLQALQKKVLQKEQLAVLGEAAAVLAHEVRNPLAVIQNGVAILRRDPLAESPRASATLGIVDEELARLERLIRDVLDAARPSQLRRESIELGEFLRNASERFQELHGDTVQVELEAATGEAEVQADAELLLLALDKLVRNAVQASPHPGSVRVRLVPEEAQCAIVVEDEGAGLAEEHLPRLFRPFFTTKAAGTGLGLTVAQQIAHAHGGTIRFVPRDPRGTRFELVLPRG